MANKTKKTTKTPENASSTTSITRIKASDLAHVATPIKKSTRKTSATKSQTTVGTKSPINVLRLIGGYFKGAWFELRQVRWPNRRATWSLTAAVLIFTAFFVVLVVLLDILFKYLFQLILG